jgi:general secretion pathway protein G
MKKGFTLIELLIVIVIIGILAGIVVGIVGTSANAKAQDAKLKANVHEVQNALEQYYIDKSAYPTVAEGLAVLVSSTPKYLNATSTYTGLTYTPVGAGYELTFDLKNKNEKIDGINVRAGATAADRTYFVTSKQE